MACKMHTLYNASMTPHTTSTATPQTPLPLSGVRIVSLALNLPGPAALMRLCAMGAECTKVESPLGDPMGHYAPTAYAQMHQGVQHVTLDLKTAPDLARLHTELAHTHVLLTSFRPSALVKLGLDWDSLHRAHPHLSMVSIVGSPGSRAEEPGHDLTYLAEHGLVTGSDLPATLYADMAGSLMAVEAVLHAVLLQRTAHPTAGAAATDTGWVNAAPQANQRASGSHHEVALSSAAAYLALPRRWGLTQPTGAVGGAHAGYRVYPCLDGRVAVAALEPHFAAALCRVAGIAPYERNTMLHNATQQALTTFFAAHTRQRLDALATAHDIPLFCMPNQAVDD
jgi:alpha-methylacyl-CoA racemase